MSHRISHPPGDILFQLCIPCASVHQLGHFVAGEKVGHFVVWDNLSPQNAGWTICRWDKMSPNRHERHLWGLYLNATLILRQKDKKQN